MRVRHFWPKLQRITPLRIVLSIPEEINIAHRPKAAADGG
jgi:hypothetical protein